MRTFAYNTISVLFGCLVFFGGILAGTIWSDDRSTFGQQLAISCVAGAITLAALVGLIVVRRRRADWLREVAIYESYAAFAAHAKEQKGLVHDIGRKFLLRGPLGLLGSIRTASIEDAYHQLQSARRRSAISEPEYRSAIDELFARAADRARL